MKKLNKRILALVCAFVLAFTSIVFVYADSEAETEQTSVTSSDKLEAYYSFDDTLTNEVTGESATLHGGAGDTWNAEATGTANYATGVSGNAYSFAGNSDTASGEGLELDVLATTAYTISYWVNASAVTSATSQVFIAQSNDDGTMNGLNIADNWFGSTYPTVRIWSDNSSFDATYLDNWTATADEFVGTWKYITLTSDGTNVVLYIDGVAVASGTSASDFAGEAIFLGINWWDTSFCGLMDEVTVYSEALSADDVAALYANDGVPYITEEETTTEETTTEETTTEETTTEETTTEASEGIPITYTVTSEETLAEGDADDATFTTFASTRTGEVTLSGDFELVYSFINYSDLDGSSLASTSTDSPFYWNNFVVEMVSNGVYVDVRADNAGWLAYAGTDDSITFDVDTTDFDWDSWLASMTAGQLCIVYIERVGTTITFKIDTGLDYFFTATAEVAEYTDDSEITIYLIGEQCTLTDVYYEATQTITEEKTLTFSEVVPVTVSDVYDADMNPYNIDLDADYEGLSDEQLAELAELFAGDFSSEAIAVTVTNDDGTEYVFSDGEGVYLCFELSAEASYDSILFLYYTEDGWQVAESDYVDEDGRYYVYFSAFESGTPIVILAGNATTTVNNTSSTPSSSDPTSTDPAATTAAPTTSASPTTADVSVWMYIVLLVGAAVVISVFAKKRVEE